MRAQTAIAIKLELGNWSQAQNKEFADLSDLDVRYSAVYPKTLGMENKILESGDHPGGDLDIDFPRCRHPRRLLTSRDCRVETVLAQSQQIMT